MNKTSEIVRLLASLGIILPGIQAAPRKYVATLTSRDSDVAVSRVFCLPARTGAFETSDTVVVSLLSEYFGEALDYGELGSCTVEYLLASHRDAHGDGAAVTVSGRDIRFCRKSPLKVPGGRRKAGGLRWEDAPEHLSIAFYPAPNGVIDDDPGIFAVNKGIARAALEKELADAKAAVLLAAARQEKLESAIKETTK